MAPAPGGRRTPARRRLVATVCVRQSSPGSGTWGPVTRPGWRLTMVKTELTSRKTHRRRFARRRQTCTGRTRGALWRPGSPRLCEWGRDPPGGAVPPVLTETPESCVGPGPPPAPHGLGWSPCMRPDVPGVTLTHFAFGGPQVSKPGAPPPPRPCQAALCPDSTQEPSGGAASRSCPVAPPARPSRGTELSAAPDPGSAPHPSASTLGAGTRGRGARVSWQSRVTESGRAVQASLR